MVFYRPISIKVGATIIAFPSFSFMYFLFKTVFEVNYTRNNQTILSLISVVLVYKLYFITFFLQSFMMEASDILNLHKIAVVAVYNMFSI